jgi:hypothetical protein
VLILRDEGLDRALAAMGNFADLMSPYLAGHSAGARHWPARPRVTPGSTRPV